MGLRVNGKCMNYPISDCAGQRGLMAGVFFHCALLAEEAPGNQRYGYVLIDNLFIKALIVSCHSACKQVVE